MKIDRRSTRVLVGVNAVLLAALVLAWIPRATAQGGAARPRGQYAMLGGKLSGSSTSGVYVVDSVNRELIALRYVRGDGGLEPFGFRDLNADSAAARRTK